MTIKRRIDMSKKRMNTENEPTIKALHTPINPLVLYNIWDAGSAKTIEKKIIEKNGNSLLATSSWAVAASHGYKDGENFPFEKALENLKEITKNVTTPVNFDFEAGFSNTIEGLQNNLTKVIECGVVGINFEDQVIEKEGARHSIENQCKRITAIREVIDKTLSDVFINARTDIFLQKPVPEHSKEDLNEAIERSIAYAKAGAHGFFAPGLENREFIKELCEASPIPVNIMIKNEIEIKNLAELGVSRVSFGPYIYLEVMSKLENYIEEGFINSLSGQQSNMEEPNVTYE
jgi:2-methylisocitrate lyase-like PEP mutase family enzyme